MARWTAEQEAYRAIADLLALAERCKELCDRAGLALPEPLKRLLGMNEGTAKLSRAVVIPPPPVKSRPPGFKDDWISVQLANATPITVVPAILQDRTAGLRATELLAKVAEVLPTVPGGSVVNTLSRLKSVGVIDKANGGGWIIKKPEAAAVLYDGMLWGPRSAFQKQEVASHRRDAILYLLGHFSSGLQIVQLVEVLGECDWLHAPVNKDLIKDDMNALLNQRKIRRRGTTKKWELAPRSSEGEV
jgi:hypothetical protein